MGSDLSLSPPTPDEKRLVRGGRTTAVYTRHTDGIYGDTRTWTRKHLWDDTTGSVFAAMHETNPGMLVVSSNEFPTEAEYEMFAVADRDLDKEVTEAERKVQRAQEKLQHASEELAGAHQVLAQLLAERHSA